MMDDKDWELFKKKLDQKTGIDLQLYKEPQMKRRIGNLVTRAEMDSFVAYFDKVSKTKEDFAELDFSALLRFRLTGRENPYIINQLSFPPPPGWETTIIQG